MLEDRLILSAQDCPRYIVVSQYVRFLFKCTFLHIKWYNNNNNNNNNNNGDDGDDDDDVDNNRYEHKPETVTKNEEVTILWDMQTNTDREASANKSDIVIKDHANRCCKLIDVSVPSDRNTSTKVNEKLSKYKDLEFETTRMWGMRTETVPVIVGAMDHNLEKIPGASNINELQKIILLGTEHILRRFLSIK